MPTMPGGYDGVAEQSTPRTENLPYPISGGLPYPTEFGGYDMGDYKDFPPHERPGHVPLQQRPTSRDSDSDLAYGTLHIPEARRKHSSSVSSQRSASSATHTAAPYRYPPSSGEQPSYQATARPYTNVNPGYTQPQQYEYAQVPEKVTYSSRPQNRTETASEKPKYKYSSMPQARAQQASPPPPPNYTYMSQPNQQAQLRESSPFPPFGAQLVDVTPGVSKQADLGLTPRMDRLSVSGNRPDMTGALPPPSPLLEPYHGTYQSISPMMAPMRLSDNELDSLPRLSRTPSSSKHRRSKSSTSSIPGSGAQNAPARRARVYDAERDALALSEAITHHRVDVAAICSILPPLTHDQMLLLRKEYKKHVRVSGSRGINMAKHVKLKLAGNFGKAVYVCALGRHESEGYWSNLWYQSHASRRELVIEALMGRSNAEVRGIKEAFRDKRYNDSLERCMEKELRRDKFGVAVLAALEARRQEESEVYPREYVDRDVDTLRRCLQVNEGGETAMLDIVCRRSDAHLRACLKAYEALYGANFAREALKRSGNLVGEIVAHVLNGAINRPARDALLLRHAIRDIATRNRDEELRYELLISRLLRVHWDPQHFARVKREFREACGAELEDEVRGAARGDFGDFMAEVCRVQG